MKDVTNAICIGGVVTGGLYIIKKMIAPTVMSSLYRKKLNINSSDDELNAEAIEKKTISFLTKGLKISKESYELGDTKINQGAKVSFDIDNLGEVLEVQGIFIGVKENRAEGYTFNFVVMSNDKVISAPVESIFTETLRVYAR